MDKSAIIGTCISAAIFLSSGIGVYVGITNQISSYGIQLQNLDEKMTASDKRMDERLAAMTTQISDNTEYTGFLQDQVDNLQLRIVRLEEQAKYDDVDQDKLEQTLTELKNEVKLLRELITKLQYSKP